MIQNESGFLVHLVGSCFICLPVHAMVSSQIPEDSCASSGGYSDFEMPGFSSFPW